jgi:hypothetical protein
MCIKCGEPSRRPLVVKLTVATSPFNANEAVPLPVTWFVGTGLAVAEKRAPAGAGGGFGGDPGVPEEAEDPEGPEEPEEVTTTPATIATTARATPSACHEYLLAPGRAA